jgi:hypothetical protein
MRGIRGQTRCDDQIDEASRQRLPQCVSQRRHPNQPGRQCNPRTPNPKWISGAGAAYMCVMQRPRIALLPIALLVAGLALTGTAIAMSATSMQAVGTLDDPPFECGSVVAPHHFPDATFATPAAAASGDRRCGAARQNRARRSAAVALLGAALLGGALILKRRDAATTQAGRQQLFQGLFSAKT